MKKKKRKDYNGRFLVRKWQYYLFYTLTWLLGALVLVSLFRKYGYTFIWVPDGAYQHFSAFNYVCEMAESLLGGQFVFSDFGPFNYTIGQGGYLFTTLNSYDLTDPVSWLCAFVVPLERTVRYTLMIFVKLWLAGIAFSVYCFATDNEDRLAVMCGALSYAFSGAIVFMAPRHPNYINWAYFLPLLLAG